ncbi:MAG: primosomal protein N' [Syntrophomonadaceae bacterium]|jgi:primosomal protein N' (replication factor Y)|nr:primosomal protein N' [Syntrophomonadaceae bacterium]
MNLIKVLVNIPLPDERNYYVYSVPDNLQSQAQVGKRVLAEWNKRRQEGWIIGCQERAEQGYVPRAIIKILDDEPLLSDGLLRLAQWTADYYCCSVFAVIQAMLPPFAIQRKAKNSVAVTASEEFDNEDFFLKPVQRLPQNGPFTDAADNAALEFSDFHKSRVDWSAYQYVIGGGFTESAQRFLRKKAPRQADIMDLLAAKRSFPAAQLRKDFSPAVLNNLREKGFIELERIANRQLESNLLLNAEQEKALETLNKALDTGKFQEFLLWGITGSGKTEIYLQAAQEVIKRGKTVLLLVPEIALTRQLVELFTARLNHVAVLHSQIKTIQRDDRWRYIKEGGAKVVMGTRMAVFAPVDNLGLVIVDEEQENTFKQEQNPRYNAREVARKRAETANALFITGSATPSLETYHNMRDKPQNVLKMYHRATNSALAEVETEDMRKVFNSGNADIISPKLRKNIELNLEKGEQSILFVHRRGYSPMTICRKCGNIAKCKRCSVALAYHQDQKANVCHYCNFQSPPLKQCPECGSVHLQQLGYGTQKVEETVRKMFPSGRVARLDVDISKTRGWQQNVLEKMKNGQIDILIGTQMVTKGLNFPNVSLVGIIDADGILNLPDFRAGERCFQLIVQAAGRAGRGDKPGRVVIQTYNPDHYIIQMAARQDYILFAERELIQRKVLQYPPFNNLLRVVLSAENESWVLKEARLMSERIEAYVDASEEFVQVLGPAPCPIERINKRHRYQIFVKSPNAVLLSSIGRHILKEKKKYTARIEVDMDPVMTM